MAEFIKGLELSRVFYEEAVRPILVASFPELAYSAALIGPGSEILGFDTPLSTDHDWGPRLRLFLAEDQVNLVGQVQAANACQSLRQLRFLAQPGVGQRRVCSQSIGDPVPEFEQTGRISSGVEQQQMLPQNHRQEPRHVRVAGSQGILGPVVGGQPPLQRFGLDKRGLGKPPVKVLATRVAGRLVELARGQRARKAA